MLKLKIYWELETGEKFEEWTIPLELALAEKEFYNGKNITGVLADEKEPSTTLLLFLAHKIHKRISDKPIPAYELWATKIIRVEATDLSHPKLSGQAQ